MVPVDNSGHRPSRPVPRAQSVAKLPLGRVNRRLQGDEERLVIQFMHRQSCGASVQRAWTGVPGFGDWPGSAGRRRADGSPTTRAKDLRTPNLRRDRAPSALWSADEPRMERRSLSDPLADLESVDRFLCEHPVVGSLSATDA